MTIEELELKYADVPVELKSLKRWVCYKVEETENGKKTKRPYNAISGNLAKVDDDITWSKFKLAVNGCVKYGFHGLGFVLGDGIFGIDLDNHPNKDGEYELNADEFKALADEFIEALDSYTEWSQSGKGIHIICRGKLPAGARRKGNVEMYDTNRFFAFTGNAIRKKDIQDREREIVPLWEKYVYTEPPSSMRPAAPAEMKNPNFYKTLSLSDAEVIKQALDSKSGERFYRYYHDGDLSMNENDHSKADQSFCCMLAFWCNKDIAQMDRIFRTSALMRDKWDEYRGKKTYGQISLESACSQVSDGFSRTEILDKVVIKNTNTDKPKDNPIPFAQPKPAPKEPEKIKEQSTEMNLDQNGEPIFRLKKIYGTYSYSDTGNAMKFYDYFGDLFKYNTTDKIFMFWTGKTWIRDTTQIIRKYANKFIDILKEDEAILRNSIEEYNRLGEKEQVKSLSTILTACERNTARVANKAGKDAMISEFQALPGIAVESSVFDNDEYLLNTDSGIVDLITGKISPFDRNKLISKNTGTKVSYEPPTVWLEFLRSVFDNGNMIETQEIIDSLQTCLGYSLTGSTREQVMFLLYGKGSNGKTTLTETIANVMGTYGDNIASSVLIQQKGQNSSAVYSIAKLQTVRFVETGETDDGGKLNESQVKLLTGGDTISAQFKFGHEFAFKPRFKIWMSTNNKPIIRGTDLGIWRRVFLFPFLNTFSEQQKDKDLPIKLLAEKDKILGWCIQGFLKYQSLGYNFIYPRIVQAAASDYKKQMDVIAQFIDRECTLDENAEIESKELYNAYKSWAQDNTEYTKKESKFSEDLSDKGIKTRRAVTGKIYYVGIRLSGVYIKHKE